MTASFTGVTTTRDLQVRAKVSGAEPVESLRHRLMISPQNVVAHYVQHDSADWELRSVRVVGGLIRPGSGTAGVVAVPRVFWGHEIDRAPQWIRDFADQHRPQETRPAPTDQDWLEVDHG